MGLWEMVMFVLAVRVCVCCCTRKGAEGAMTLPLAMFLNHGRLARLRLPTSFGWIIEPGITDCLAYPTAYVTSSYGGPHFIQ